MRFISLFSGVGGFDLALKRLGYTCVYANDIDKYCKIIYEKNFQHKLDCRSIKDVSENEIPAHEILCGGFPCQSFSIAGKRRGFEDTRGTLFFDIARIARHHRPRILFLENVKGLLSHDRGRTFKIIISTFAELGYDCQWQVLNSKNFGVPQNRERVFIVGHLRGTPRPEVFPIGHSDQKNNESGKKTTGEYSQSITTQGGINARGTFVKTAYALDANYYKGTNTIKKSRRQLIQVNNPRHSNDRLYSDKGISPTLNTMQGGRRQPFITVPVLTPDRLNNGFKIRRLTPIECERLQGFPDNWTKGVSDTQRYKQMGNAVTVNVVFEIAKLLFK